MPGPVPHVTWNRGTELPWPSARYPPRSAHCTSGNQRTPCSCSHGPHVARGEVDEPLGPGAAPAVGAVGREVGGPEPVRERELGGVLDAEAALLGGVDEEQAAERPERLAAQARGGLGVEQRDPATGGDQLGGGDEAGEARADDHDIGVRHGSYGTRLDVRPELYDHVS